MQDSLYKSARSDIHSIIIALYYGITNYLCKNVSTFTLQVHSTRNYKKRCWNHNTSVQQALSTIERMKLYLQFNVCSHFSYKALLHDLKLLVYYFKQ